MASREHAVDVRITPRLDAVVVRPGDTLVVCVATSITPERFDEHVARVKERLPSVEVLFLTAEQLLVYRPDDTTAAVGKPPADTSWLRSLDA